MVHRWLRTEAAQTLCLTHGKLHSSTFRCTCACVWVMRSSCIFEFYERMARTSNCTRAGGFCCEWFTCVWCNALIARARSTTTDAMGIALWQLLFVCVWHISFPHIYRVCLMLIIEWLLFTRNVCILISHSTECRATEHTEICTQSARASTPFDTAMLTQPLIPMRALARDIITYLHSYAVFLPLFSCDAASKLKLNRFVATSSRFALVTCMSGKLDNFATFETLTVDAVAYEAQHSRNDKMALELKINDCQQMVWSASVYMFNFRTSLEKQIRTYPVEFFRQPFEHLIHSCRQAK